MRLRGAGVMGLRNDSSEFWVLLGADVVRAPSETKSIPWRLTVIEFAASVSKLKSRAATDCNDLRRAAADSFLPFDVPTDRHL